MYLCPTHSFQVCKNEQTSLDIEIRLWKKNVQQSLSKNVEVGLASAEICRLPLHAVVSGKGTTLTSHAQGPPADAVNQPLAEEGGFLVPRILM